MANDWGPKGNEKGKGKGKGKGGKGKGKGKGKGMRKGQTWFCQTCYVGRLGAFRYCKFMVLFHLRFWVVSTPVKKQERAWRCSKLGYCRFTRLAWRWLHDLHEFWSNVYWERRSTGGGKGGGKSVIISGFRGCLQAWPCSFTAWDLSCSGLVLWKRWWWPNPPQSDRKWGERSACHCDQGWTVSLCCILSVLQDPTCGCRNGGIRRNGFAPSERCLC